MSHHGVCGRGNPSLGTCVTSVRHMTSVRDTARPSCDGVATDGAARDPLARHRCTAHSVLGSLDTCVHAPR
eukprot:624124-Prymnesium_polylepis.1